METLSSLETLDGYRRLFFDANFWTPYVQMVCARHGLAVEPIRTGIAGTCPVFIVADQWVVKFFGRLFEGGEGFAAEKDAARIIGDHPAIPTARVAASGELGGPGWPWPYLVFHYIEGASIGTARDGLAPESRERMAAGLGSMITALHALPLDGSGVFPNDHAAALRFLERQRSICVQNHLDWGSLPARLVAQIDDFLPPLETLLDFNRPPHLIHADLTGDHLLGRVENGQWTSLALIDFGDAMTGSLYYELAALHMDLFGKEKKLLKSFIDSYGISAEARTDFSRKTMAAALLHRFDVFAGLTEEEREVQTLSNLAEYLWAVDR